MKTRFLLIPLVVLCTVGVFSKDNCVPDCSGKKVLDRVTDPLNCTKYFICGNCSGPVNCTPKCEPPACHLTCNGSLDSISDPNDCGIYYICSAGNILGPISCPKDRPYFDGKTCTTDSSQCCSGLCTPYCQAGIVEAPDPVNCTNYYICSRTGPADEKLHFSCPSGENFDVAQGHCIPGAKCTIMCPKTTVPGSHTTPSGGGSSVMPTTDCLDNMKCNATGYFPKCASCQQDYFHCWKVHEDALVETCTGDLVFNTDPSYPYCIDPTTCPRHR
ncbi:uncharacterized protein LOC121857264 [Homarus americanus]|uniref:uncharacterized protein LOC121857264 n=1 Tax=Homarus americanus TaxID=6706 RepID=UPI001C45BAA5|nr:uncharacterized protein LOC121857264 [Homarus americanus]